MTDLDLTSSGHPGPLSHHDTEVNVFVPRVPNIFVPTVHLCCRYGVLLILLLPSLVLSDICSLDVCDCEDSEVRCQGDNTEDILITPASLPPLLTSLTFANFSNIKIHTNSFGGQNDLKELR